MQISLKHSLCFSVTISQTILIHIDSQGRNQYRSMDGDVSFLYHCCENTLMLILSFRIFSNENNQNVLGMIIPTLSFCLLHLSIYLAKFQRIRDGFIKLQTI